MKIAFIVSGFPTLSQTFVLNQITGLLDLGHDVEIFARSNPNEPKKHPDIDKYHLIERTHYMPQIPHNLIKRRLKAIYLIITNFHQSPLRILKSLNIHKYGKHTISLIYTLIPFLDEKFDIIQCHFGPCGNLGSYLIQIGVQGKLVTMFHGYDVRLGIKEGKNIYSQLFKVGDCFLAISDYNYKNLVRFGVNPEKIILHTVGIDVNKFSYRYQSTADKSTTTIKIITVARLVEEKGLKYGIQAISKLLKRNPELNLEYHIVGEGELEGDLRKLVKELSLEEVVCFIEPMDQEEIIGKMQQAHIFILPSIAEALPVVLMEAQAVGLPVVATSVGGVSQVIIDGKSGFLVPERDVDALAEKIEYLIEHPELWPEMGRCGRKFIEERYDIQKLNQRLVKIYKALLTNDTNAFEELRGEQLT